MPVTRTGEAWGWVTAWKPCEVFVSLSVSRSLPPSLLFLRISKYTSKPNQTKLLSWLFYYFKSFFFFLNHQRNVLSTERERKRGRERKHPLLPMECSHTVIPFLHFSISSGFGAHTHMHMPNMLFGSLRLRFEPWSAILDLAHYTTGLN